MIFLNSVVFRNSLIENETNQINDILQFVKKVKTYFDKKYSAPDPGQYRNCIKSFDDGVKIYKHNKNSCLFSTIPICDIRDTNKNLEIGYKSDIEWIFEVCPKSIETGKSIDKRNAYLEFNFHSETNKHFRFSTGGRYIRYDLRPDFEGGIEETRSCKFESYDALCGELKEALIKAKTMFSDFMKGKISEQDLNFILQGDDVQLPPQVLVQR